MDVGQNTSLGDGDTRKQLVQLLVIPDGELEMTGDDPGLLVVPDGVTGQLEDLSCEVLHDGGLVDTRRGHQLQYARGSYLSSEACPRETTVRPCQT